MVLVTNKNTWKSGDGNKQSKCNIPEIKRVHDGFAKKIGGVQMWWCPHHKWKQEFDGLYMPHKPGKEHEE